MKEFDELVEIMERLRAPGGCPWDAKQNHASIAHCAVEEAYELQDAIVTGDSEHMCEELGDLLLQVVFHSIIARDQGEFTLAQVIKGLAAKLVHRHPHVFGDAVLGDAAEVSRNWEELKRQEKGKETRKGLFDGIPSSLPALPAARKIQSVAKRAGYAWGSPDALLEAIGNDLGQLAIQIQQAPVEECEVVMGRILFGVVNLARTLEIDPETALRGANEEAKNDLVRRIQK